MRKATQLASGLIDGRDLLRVLLIKSGPGRPQIVQIVWPTPPTVVDAGQYPATAAAAMRLLAEASFTLVATKVYPK
jgi:hypothetical protein